MTRAIIPAALAVLIAAWTLDGMLAAARGIIAEHQQGVQFLLAAARADGDIEAAVAHVSASNALGFADQAIRALAAEAPTTPEPPTASEAAP